MKTRTLVLSLILASSALSVTQVGCSGMSKRSPSSTEARSVELPPLAAKGQTTWVYTWSNSPAALANPQAYIQGQLDHGAECVNTLATSKAEGDIPGCEGNELLVGAGVYVCDNPFTAHDYGSILVGFKALGGAHPVAMLTNRFTPRQSDGALPREISGNKNYDGIMYDFRSSDMNGRALVIRSQALADVSSSAAISLDPSRMTFKKLADHAPFACSAQTPMSAILPKWGDHLEFLSLTYDASRDPEANDFHTGDSFNSAGVAAMIASDAVAMPPATLDAKLKVMMNQSTELKESLDPNACRDTESISPKMCLAQRIYNSLIDENGTPNHPTYTFKFSLLARTLIALGAVDAKAIAGVHSNTALLKQLVKVVKANPTRSARASEAFNCMKVIKAGVLPTNFATWGEDPQ